MRVSVDFLPDGSSKSKKRSGLPGHLETELGLAGPLTNMEALAAWSAEVSVWGGGWPVRGHSSGGGLSWLISTDSMRRSVTGRAHVHLLENI